MTLKHKPQSADVNDEENERPRVALLCVTEQTCLHLFCLEKTNDINNMINQDLEEITA